VSDVSRCSIKKKKPYVSRHIRTPIHNKQMLNRRRVCTVMLIFLIGLTAVLTRLLWLMVFKHEGYAQKAKGQYEREKELASPRGFVYDRKMRELAVNIKTKSLYGEPNKIHDAAAVSRTISPIIRISQKRLNSKLTKSKKFVWIARKLELNKSEKIRKLHINGLGFVEEMKRYYPRGSLASHIIGFVGMDNYGLEGLEKKYDFFMKGKSGSFIVHTDARGKEIFQNISEPVPGNNIVLTIDERLQYIVEKELEGAIKKWKAKAAVSIMMDPNTGEILALANKPDYNPNFAGKFDAEARRNRAVTDMYEPGSTFKAVAASAALEEKIVTMNKLFDCSKGYIQVSRKRIRDAHRHGILTFKQIIQKSSNVGTIQVANLLGKSRFYKYMKAFGIGQKTNIDLHGEVRGLLIHPKYWSGLSLASMAIGQEVGVTPLQIVRLYSVIANGGKLMRPYVVSQVISPSDEIIKSNYPRPVRQVISQETSRKMRTILKTVVEDGGTAVKAAIEGNPVAGKTGTAQIIDPKTKRYSRTKYVSSFVGFVPADEPRLALIAPVFKNIVEQSLAYLDVPVEQEKPALHIAHQ
jgi:cell division protein FtsI/penicillin-binding protein 2